VEFDLQADVPDRRHCYLQHAPTQAVRFLVAVLSLFPPSDLLVHLQLLCPQPVVKKTAPAAPHHLCNLGRASLVVFGLLMRQLVVSVQLLVRRQNLAVLAPALLLHPLESGFLVDL
jgi:hypothetical protein